MEFAEQAQELVQHNSGNLPQGFYWAKRLKNRIDGKCLYCDASVIGRVEGKDYVSQDGIYCAFHREFILIKGRQRYRNKLGIPLDTPLLKRGRKSGSVIGVYASKERVKKLLGIIEQLKSEIKRLRKLKMFNRKIATA